MLLSAEGRSGAGLRAHGVTVPGAVGRSQDVKGALELVHLIVWGNTRARVNVALDIGPEGFSEGKVCAVPDPAPVTAAVA